VIWAKTHLTDLEGGLEYPGRIIFVPPFFIPTPDIYGTINMTPVHQENRTFSSVDVWWTGWGRPNALAEPGFQAVGQRTSTNIWHSPEVRLLSDNGVGKHVVLEPQTVASRFPSHRIWVNGRLEWNRDQRELSSLWTASPANSAFVIEGDGNSTFPRL